MPSPVTKYERLKAKEWKMGYFRRSRPKIIGKKSPKLPLDLIVIIHVHVHI